jgi:hypothetical protein
VAVVVVVVAAVGGDRRGVLRYASGRHGRAVAGEAGRAGVVDDEEEEEEEAAEEMTKTRSFW